MNKPVYDVEFSFSENQYIFESVGQQGIILKVVKFTEIQENLYNLGFGDYNPTIKQVDDQTVSDNGDMTKVLSTVVRIIVEFTGINPTASIFVEGSTKSRTRLYQIAIHLHYEDFSKHFEIFGLVGESYEPFQKNKSYESFIIRKLF